MKALHKLLFFILLISLGFVYGCRDKEDLLKIYGVIGPEIEEKGICKFEFSDKKTRIKREGIFDLSYNKLLHSVDKQYGYIVYLGLINTLPDEIEVRSDVSSDINTIKVKGYDINVYNPNHVLVYKEHITKEKIIGPDSNSLETIRLFSDINVWEGPQNDESRDTLFTPFYPNGELQYDYVLVEIKAVGETGGGEDIDSDPFIFRINLCVDCLICPYEGDGPRCNEPNTVFDACSHKSIIMCGIVQDYPMECKIESEGDN